MRSSWRFLPLVFATLWCAVSGAQQLATPPGVYRIGGDVKAPTLIYKQEAEYSEAARTAKLQGSVMLYAVIGEDGRARGVQVIRSLGLGLDENAIAAVLNWRFAPGTKADQPVPVESTIEVNFRLQTDPREWSLAGLKFTAPQGASQPALLHSQYWAPSGLPENAAVRVSFDVAAQGAPTNIQVDGSSDPKWDDEVTALIREWRFQAALDHGVAVESRGFTISHAGWSHPLPLLRWSTACPVLLFRRRRNNTGRADHRLSWSATPTRARTQAERPPHKSSDT